MRAWLCGGGAVWLSGSLLLLLPLLLLLRTRGAGLLLLLLLLLIAPACQADGRTNLSY
jgi:hypothetical protein